MTAQQIESSDAAEWTSALTRVHQHDIYHSRGYHVVAENHEEGKAVMFVYRRHDYVIAFPLLVRPLKAVPGLERLGEGWSDATSVYGYAGPVASHADVPTEVRRGFHESLRAMLAERRIVSVFSRCHPLIPQTSLLEHLGELQYHGLTVSIDLTLPDHEQKAGYRSNHRRDLKKLNGLGVECVRREGLPELEEFVDLYRDTMERVGASESYLLDRRYFEDLVCALGDTIHLFTARYQDRTIAGGLFTTTDGIVEYHLGGTRSEDLRMGPMKLVFETVRAWATGLGLRVFHLGGGVGAQADPLFAFKAGFSDRRHEFYTFRWIVDHDAYAAICEKKQRWNLERSLEVSSSEYFPEYRAPAR